MTGTVAGPARSAWRRVLSPPVRDPRFWTVQGVVACLAAAHLVLDIVLTAEPTAIPAGVPVALLLAPIGYAAMRFGLSGSVATAILATLLWLPDLLLPRDRGHAGNDLIELALVIAVAVFVGYHIDSERLERAQAQRARKAQQLAEARYRQLFDINVAPILVTSEQGMVLDANPAALALTSENVVGRAVHDILGTGTGQISESDGKVIAIAPPGDDTHYYRVNIAHMPARPEQEPLAQLVLQDVTADRAEGDRAHRFAELLLMVQEEERRRIAQELHDEPLQLLVQLARALERLETGAGHGPATIADGLHGARDQTLDVASRLRSVVAGLRPPALAQLGLVTALRGFFADIGESGSIRTDLRVTGEPARLAPDVELGAFRIAQEAVNNVIRHAQASQLLLMLKFSDDELCLRVADDGCGFDPAAADRQLAAGHLGLLGMRERAALGGGWLTVSSAPGAGTVVEVTFPRNGQADDLAIKSRART